MTSCAFDLLASAGRSLFGLPVEERKRQLAALLTPSPPSVLYVGHFGAEHGRQLFEQAVHQLRGAVSAVHPLRYVRSRALEEETQHVTELQRAH